MSNFAFQSSYDILIFFLPAKLIIINKIKFSQKNETASWHDEQTAAVLLCIYKIMNFIPILFTFFSYDSALRNRNGNMVVRDKISHYCRNNLALTRDFVLPSVLSHMLQKQSYQKLRLSSEVEYSVEKKSTGHAHSNESKAKISAANKGKVPWNLGRQHSEETKRRIAEKTKESYLKKNLAEADKLGLSLEEMEKSKMVS